MIPTHFSNNLIHEDRARESEGALDKIFVRLVYDLLKAEYPTLCYPNGGGKDGAIDLWSDVGTERHVFECKQIGVERKQPPWKAAQSEWCKVRDNLQKNLQKGVEGCHSPYRPWFSNCPRVVRYTYIVSCSIAPPLDRMDELRQEIKGVFESLSATSETLCHLRNIVVEVVDWDALRRRLEVQPQVFFKWFKDYLPVGLRQLTQVSQLSGFRRYKQEAALPYYSLRAHLAKHPQDGIQNEATLWETLLEGTAGLVISGVSGVGKSRLMMELGNLAAQDGWLVFEVLRNANPETIDRTARSFPSPGVLFLFDYLENCPAFRDMSLHVAQLAGSGVNVRLVASARESFVRSDLIVDDSMLILPHSPQGDANSAWWDSYRLATFRHITGHLGVELQSDSPSDIPVVAVLESELQRANSSQSEAEPAKTWTGRRLDILLQGEKISKKSLALLAAQCPLDDEAYVRLCDEPRDAFVALWNSGWIEDRETEAGHRYYRLIHDYLADQIVLHWLETESPRGLGKAREIREILKLAYTLGSLGSAIAALQRIIEKISGFGVADFSDLIESEIAANRMIWAMHRQDLLYTRLLSPIAKVHLLHRLGSYWQGAESETWFQLEVAVLAKALAITRPPAAELPAEVREGFESLVASLASGADERNMLVTYGLRLLPNSKQLQQVALDWLGKFADRFGATYVIRAWLDMKLPSREVEPAIRVWLSRFGNTINAQFVLAAWLRGAGVDSVTRFETETLEWCERHGTEAVAQHVYSGWLRAGGKPQSISGYVEAWLTRNWTLEEEPSFLLRRWLRASGSASLILPYARKWIDRHGSADSASFVYSAAADFVELGPLVREPMLMWISARSTSPLARPCIVAWLRARCDRSSMTKYVREWLSANDTMEEAGEVISKWLEAEGKLEMVLPHAITWIGAYGDSPYANFVLKALLENAKSSDEIRDLALRWLELNSHRFEAEPVLSAWIRGGYNISIIQQFVLEWCRLFPTETCARYLYEQWLLAGGSYEALFDNILAWLAEHGLDRDAGRALAALLRAGVPWKRFVEPLKQWTERHKRDREATFFYSAWLADSERNPSLIDNAIRAWLDHHAEWKDADFLLNAWLKRENAPTGSVRAGYDRYMAVHGQSSQAQTVRKNWEIAVELERKARIDKLRFRT